VHLISNWLIFNGARCVTSAGSDRSCNSWTCRFCWHRTLNRIRPQLNLQLW